MFSNRLEASQLLVQKLDFMKKDENAIVVAIPNGGIMTAYFISTEFNIPLEIELVKKIRHPDDASRSIGAISIHGTYFDENSGVTSAFFENEADTYKERLIAKHDLFLGNRAVRSLNNHTVILVDDGIETGNTISLAIQLIKTQQPSKIILAVPVAPKSILEQLRSKVDDVICLDELLPNETIKDHYHQFKKVKDSTVIRLLRE